MAGEVVLIEPMDGGLVTARDPSMLNPGEMQRCNNTIYRPNDQAIWKAPGRNAYNSSALAAAVKGLRVLSYDDLANPWIIAYHGTTIVKSEMVDEAENFTSVSTAQGSGATLDSVFYNNKHYLLKGVAADDGNALEGPNLAVLSTGSNLLFRRHGLAPVVSGFSVSVQAGSAGSWPATTLLPLGWYFFLITEVHDAGGPDELESAFEGTPLPAKITANTQFVRITLPAQLVNDGTDSAGTALVNKYRVYMSTAQGTQPDGSVDATQPETPSLDAFNQVAEIPVVASGTTDIRSGGTSYPTTGLFKIAGTGTNITGWSNPTNVGNDNNVGATTSTAPSTMVAHTFGNAGISGTISGIEIQIKYKNYTASGRLPGIPTISVALTKTAAGANTAVTPYFRTTTGAISYKVNTFGDPANLWGTTWVAGDLTANTFGVLIQADQAGQVADVDAVWVRVWTGAIVIGKPYPVVSINVGDELIVESANSEPPVASTGDTFESQMVLNEISRKPIVRYSIPDKPEYFPKDYYLQFSSKEQDIVTCIRKLGNKLIVGLKNQLYRVNYLPRQLDAEFDRGRAVEALSETHGIVGTQASALFSPPDKPQLLAYVSSQGIHATDGYQTTTLSEDLDWQNTVAQAYLHNVVLVNYPKLYSLVMYYTPSGATTNTKALWFNYHPSHVKQNGKLLVSGPNDVRAISSHLARKDNDWILLTGHLSDGKVYVEDREYDSDDSLSRGDVDILTRTIYPAGIGYEATVERVWWRHSASSPVITWTTTVYVQNTDTDPTLPTEWEDDTFDTTYKTLSRLDAIHVLGEAFLVNLTNADLGATGNAGNSISYMGLEVGAHGLQDNPS